jgi:hypothetical protein
VNIGLNNGDSIISAKVFGLVGPGFSWFTRSFGFDNFVIGNISETACSEFSRWRVSLIFFEFFLISRISKTSEIVTSLAY